jgi:ATP-dependent helicase/nuclease subunit B
LIVTIRALRSMANRGLFTIPPTADFIATLANFLLTDSQERGCPLADYSLYLPTRRAERALKDALLSRNGKALLLPRTRLLGEPDEDDLAFAVTDIEFSLNLPPAIAPERRALLLMQLLQKRDANLSAAMAWRLALSLGALLDDLQRHAIPLTRLAMIAPQELAHHWQESLTFLQIITEHWPALLEAEGKMDPILRARALIDKQIAAWQQNPPATPIIAAGSTASQPATAALLTAIAKLPQGLVILPALDQAMPQEIWESETLDATHPQFSLREWLQTLEIPRRQIRVIPHQKLGTDARIALLQNALLPAVETQSWRQNLQGPLADEALSGLAMVTAETRAEEAMVIALRLRAILEEPDKTGMLVTRDRKLAARVAQNLRRWNVIIDDSAGQPLAETGIGIFLQLILASAQPEASSVDYLALLRHPLTALRYDRPECRRLARLIELHFWRGQRLVGSALRSQSDWLRHAPATLAQEHRDAITEFLLQLNKALQPLHELQAGSAVAYTDFLQALITTAESFATSPELSGTEQLWDGEAGEAAAELLRLYMTETADLAAVSGADMPALITQWLRSVTLRPVFSKHPRLAILGPLEARLLHADCVILGGLNEGDWPASIPPDPWLSRPMRLACGLPAPEWRIGQAAQDWYQLAARGDVLFTRAAKIDGNVTMPARFLERLETLLRASGIASIPKADHWLRLARHYLVPPELQITPMPRPAPRPAAADRPRRFKLTDIAAWRRNPYAFYAKRILRLEPLPELMPDLRQADYGTHLHRLLQKFVTQHLQDWPDPAAGLQELLALGEAELTSHVTDPALRAAWSARWSVTAEWFMKQEAQRRNQGVRPSSCETTGFWHWHWQGSDYELIGRADRIDQSAEGYEIIDYKTGTVPSFPQIKDGIEPQLPLLGTMLKSGGFRDLRNGAIAALSYWQLSGREGKHQIKIYAENVEVNALIASATDQLQKMIIAYSDAAMPYLYQPQPRFAPKDPAYDDYLHLGRMQEWGLIGDAAADDDDATESA